MFFVRSLALMRIYIIHLNEAYSSSRRVDSNRTMGPHIWLHRLYDTCYWYLKRSRDTSHGCFILYIHECSCSLSQFEKTKLNCLIKKYTYMRPITFYKKIRSEWKKVPKYKLKKNIRNATFFRHTFSVISRRRFEEKQMIYIARIWSILENYIIFYISHLDAKIGYYIRVLNQFMVH